MSSENWQHIVDRGREWARTPGVGFATKASAYQAIGLGQYHLGQYEAARRSLKTALTFADQTPTHVFLARCLMKMGRIQQALTEYTLVVSRDITYFSEAADEAKQHGFQVVRLTEDSHQFGLRAMTRSNHGS